MTAPSTRIRRFRFNLPQRIAAGLLGLFLLQGFWLIFRQPRLATGEINGAGISSFFALILVQLFLLATGVILGGALWWVTRRLFGNLGGYTALALYCFSPAILRACLAPNLEILAALGIYGGIYTCIGVAHAMQGPRRKWRPRIVLLTAIFFATAVAHIAALAIVAIAGLAFMLWVAEGRRKLIFPVVFIAVAGASAARLVCYLLFPQNFALSFFTIPAPGFSLASVAHFFATPAHAGITLAAAAAFAYYLGSRRSRYFGNTVPLLSALVLLILPIGSATTPGLWALPFLLTFIGGIFADAFEGTQKRFAMTAAGGIVLLQAVCDALSMKML
jgi:hypothetical protein